jgi:hypothetical protein
MTSEIIYTDKSYVVYHITYSGNKLPSKFNSNISPSNYIGSTSIEQINKGYMGSIRSKKYKDIWKSELKNNPHLFKLEIISYHDTRPDATYKELQIQKLFNIVKNPLFVNMSYAQPNGYFGRDISGENNSNYNNKWSDEQKYRASTRIKLQHKEVGKLQFMSNDTLKKSLQISILLVSKYITEGWYVGRTYMNTKKSSIVQKELAIIKNSIRCSCLICHEELPSVNFTNHIKLHSTGIEYFGKIFVSYSALYKQTGCSKELYKKYYLNNIDPRPRIGSNGPPEKNYNIIFKL